MKIGSQGEWVVHNLAGVCPPSGEHTALCRCVVRAPNQGVSPPNRLGAWWPGCTVSWIPPLSPASSATDATGHTGHLTWAPGPSLALLSCSPEVRLVSKSYLMHPKITSPVCLTSPSAHGHCINLAIISGLELSYLVSFKLLLIKESSLQNSYI